MVRRSDLSEQRLNVLDIRICLPISDLGYIKREIGVKNCCGAYLKTIFEQSKFGSCAGASSTSGYCNHAQDLGRILKTLICRTHHRARRSQRLRGIPSPCAWQVRCM